MVHRNRFITKSTKVHNHKYDYSFVEYKNTHTHVTIVCPKHGKFSQLPMCHVRGEGCAQCFGNTRKTTEEFIHTASQIHKGRYDYSLVEYINVKTKVDIICKHHGVFKQSPDHHINKKGGCAKCAGNVVKTTPEFISKALKIHGAAYDYSEVTYINSKTPVRLKCSKHGIFTITPEQHILKHGGCGKCSPTFPSNTTNFIQRATNVHNHKYDYSLVEYKNIDTPITIICPKHGKFTTSPKIHLRGSQCKQCYLDQKVGSYTVDRFRCDPALAQSSGYVYAVELTDLSSTKFIKIGISTNYKKRINQYVKMNPNVLHLHKSTLKDVFGTEQQLLQLLANEKYDPQNSFGGHTECVQYNDYTINTINSTFNNLVERCQT